MALAKPKQRINEELAGQLDKLPSPEDVAELCSVLRVATLRELETEIVNGSIEHVRGDLDRVEFAKLINS